MITCFCDSNTKVVLQGFKESLKPVKPNLTFTVKYQKQSFYLQVKATALYLYVNLCLFVSDRTLQTFKIEYNT